MYWPGNNSDTCFSSFKIPVTLSYFFPTWRRQKCHQPHTSSLVETWTQLSQHWDKIKFSLCFWSRWIGSAAYSELQYLHFSIGKKPYLLNQKVSSVNNGKYYWKIVPAILLQNCTANHITSLKTKINPSQKPKCPIILILRDSEVIPSKWFYLNLAINSCSQTDFEKDCMFGVNRRNNKEQCFLCAPHELYLTECQLKSSAKG